MKPIDVELLTIRFRFLKKQTVVILSKPQGGISKNAENRALISSSYTFHLKINFASFLLYKLEAYQSEKSNSSCNLLELYKQ